MPGLIVAPSLPKVLIERQGIFSVHREDAMLECNCPALRGPCGGIALDDIPLALRRFQLLCIERAKRFVERQKPRGFEWHGAPLLLHGPWPSKVQNLQDASSSVWASARNRDSHDDEEHPERVLHVVSDWQPSGEGHVFMDYILVGTFLYQDKMTDLEVASGI